MNGFPVLSVLTFFPLLGALAILAFVRGQDERANDRARWAALIIALVNFVLSLGVLWAFDSASANFQMVELYRWIPAWKISYHRGVDGLSIWFVVASAYLIPVCILSAWGSVKTRVKEFMVALLVLETMMIGMFTALDFVLFYLFFEGVLIPMFLIIGVWGGPGRIYAAYKFFLFTFTGSVLMLLAIIAMYLHAGTTDMPTLMQTHWPVRMQVWLWLAFFASFAAKSPMWPFHTWLPYAHVEAPTAGSVILAGILLKMGGYGLIRVSIEMLPLASEFFAPLVMLLSVIAIIYTSLVALVQTDLKKLIAYSSVAHMGFVTLGAFALNQLGLEGSVMVMLSHTLVSSALFLCVGVVYDRLHTREISRYGGLATNMPCYAVFFMIFTLASIGVPGTSGFIGEFLSMQGMFAVSTWATAGAALGMVLSAAYMLWLYRRMFYGPLEKADVKEMQDLSPREYVMFLPLAALVIWMGVHPASFKDSISATLHTIVVKHDAAILLP